MSKFSGNAEIIALDTVIEAYKRINISQDTLIQIQLESALNSLNILLSEWTNNNNNSWKQEILTLPTEAGIPVVELDGDVKKVISVSIAQSYRLLDNTKGYGLLYEPEQWTVALNVPALFNDNPYSNEAISKNAEAVWLQYNYSSSTIVNVLGIQASDDCTLNFSLSGIFKTSPNNKHTILNDNVDFFADKLKWFRLDNITLFDSYEITIEQLGPNGKVTNVSLKKIYFNGNPINYLTTKISRSQYFAYNNKTVPAGMPTMYCFERLNNPRITLYPTPSADYKCIEALVESKIQSVDNILDTIDIPDYYLEALVSGLAFKLSEKENPQLTQQLEAKYLAALNLVTREDTDNVPITITRSFLDNYIY